MERYELAKERIAQIPDEKMAEEPYCDFFTKEAMFLQQVIHVMDHGIAGKNLEELQEQNHELYQDILPENYENSYGKANFLSECAKDKQSITVVIGCEGGFSNQEVEEMESMGFTSITLGSRILRAETAAMYACSILSEMYEDRK